jgi:hypothetical protein
MIRREPAVVRLPAALDTDRGRRPAIEMAGGPDRLVPQPPDQQGSSLDVHVTARQERQRQIGVPSGSRERTGNDAKRHRCTRTQTRSSRATEGQCRWSENWASQPCQGGGRGFESRRPLQEAVRGPAHLPEPLLRAPLPPLVTPTRLQRNLRESAVLIRVPGGLRSRNWLRHLTAGRCGRLTAVESCGRSASGHLAAIKTDRIRRGVRRRGFERTSS